MPTKGGKMANNRLGEIRRSAVIMTFGPGAVVDFRAQGAPVSAVLAGIEEWDRWFPPAGLKHPQSIMEPRLQRKLAVKGFRLPPVVIESRRDKNDQPDDHTLVAVRFPVWLQCPKCSKIAPADTWGQEPGRAYRYCGHCTNKEPGQRRVFVVPVRFIMACPAGHLSEFPWHSWVEHEKDCKWKDNSPLYLRSERPGLAGLILSCPKCKASRSMDGIFSSATWRNSKCHGRRPWLTNVNEECSEKPRALQRGASNLYFPVIESALSIPPWSDALQEALGVYWSDIVDTNTEDREQFIAILARNALKSVLEEFNLTPKQLARRIGERVLLFSSDDILNIRWEEYRQFLAGSDPMQAADREFEIRNVEVPQSLRRHFEHVTRVVRLREVRAIRGFTRINPPGDEENPNVAQISIRRLDWLPAVEVRGEGIFLTLSKERLHNWEAAAEINVRADKVQRAWVSEWRQRHGEGEPSLRITPRFLLIHTFAHALMRQLTLECGYSSAALRERLYVSEGNDGMAGILIYTATSDSDGTLGGLQRQGTPSRIEKAVVAAIKAMEWCSSDPLCIEEMMTVASGLSLAACHACVLAPETACEEYNRFLDRAMLVGIPGDTTVGFFSDLIEG